jgi:5-methylcytosine-specific restriction endonuclease McrA
MKIKVTEEMLKSSKTERGGFRSAQIKFAQKIVGKKWKQGILANGMESEDWVKFCSLSQQTRRQRSKERSLEKRLKQSSDAKLKSKIKRMETEQFYSSREWYIVRYRVIRKYESKCMACGRSPKEHGIVIHVDHIKPRSKFPELALEFNNLQLLCMECNIGKSNKDQTDWRQNVQCLTDEEFSEIEVAQEAMNRL